MGINSFHGNIFMQHFRASGATLTNDIVEYPLAHRDSDSPTQ